MENKEQMIATGQPDVPRRAIKVGNMTYLVGVHFNENSKMDVGDRLKRVILSDLEQKRGKSDKKTIDILYLEKHIK